MKSGILLLVFCLGGLVGCDRGGSRESSVMEGKSYAMTGIVERASPEDRTLTISHQPVGKYMPAMTMPFKVRNPAETNGLHAGDEVTFRLIIAGTQSWVEGIKPQGARLNHAVSTAKTENSRAEAGGEAAFSFTNELGAKVNLGDFNGQAVALDFIFTRCPVPDYCPRLSKNFAEASQKLASMPNLGTNWHFLSVSFDPDYDTPEVLRAYAERYRYDSNHWSFLTGSKEQIGRLTTLFSLDVQADGGLFNHGFRTIIIDTSNHVQQIYPFAGNFSDDIVQKMSKVLEAGK